MDTQLQLYASYVDYVIQRYQHCTIVFDGYEEGPTTKDPAHQGEQEVQ